MVKNANFKPIAASLRSSSFVLSMHIAHGPKSPAQVAACIGVSRGEF
jgi:hypothetical protein